MRGLRYYISFVLCFIIFLLTGCRLQEHSIEYNENEVKLFARMGVHLSVESKTKGAVTSSTDSVLKIGIIRLDNSAPYFNSCQNPPLTATLSEPIQNEGNLRTVSAFSSPQFFLNNTDKVTYTAWYPWPVASNDNGSLNAGIPEGYNYTSDANGTTVTFPITGDSDIMYSNVVEGKMSDGFDVMQFNHALSLFRIYAYRSTTQDWGNLTSLNISGLPNVCTITLPKNEANPNHTIEYSIPTNENKLDLNFLPDNNTTIPIPIGFDKKTFITEWIAAGAPTNEDNLKQLDIRVKTSEYGETQIPISIARDFKPGYVYDIVLRFSDKGIINAQIEVSNWKDGGDINSDIGSSGIFYNLSANGTANCYIVSSANFGYSFDATVKGNGNTTSMPGNSISTAVNAKFVDIVWADGVTTTGNRPDFQLETNKIVEGKVLFKINGDAEDLTDKSLVSEGNVLLGVYDKEGEGRQCLWTWHIWITDKPQDQNYKDGYISLDRNLGATASTPTGIGTMSGLFYQWGRPTPFHLTTENGNKTIAASNSYTRVTPDVAVANPNIFYGRFNSTNNGAATEGEEPNDPGDYHDWVDRDQFKYVNNLWGYREEEHEQPVKTIYDPCPQGYHVPYARTWEKLNNYPNNMPADKVNGDWPPANGIHITIEGQEVWYPYQGFINKDGVYRSGHIHLAGISASYVDMQIVEMWSALINRHDADDIAGNLTGEQEKINDSPYRFMFNKTDHATLSDVYTNRSRGLAVRCVSNNTADVVKNLSASQTSNCYMVHEDGYYKFKATVRGNGVGSLLPLGGTTTAEINGGLSTTISPAKVDILWWQGDFTKSEDFQQTQNNAKPANMCLSLLDNGIVGSDGYVAFQISGFSKGNVILAAYDGTGEDANILWTWHIWLTDKPSDKISGNYTKMDRFLGATFAPGFVNKPIVWNTGEQQATLGFYYQWGRKDPIIGPPAINSGTYDQTTDKMPSSGWWEHKQGNWTLRNDIDIRSQATILDVVKYPTAFYTSETERSNTNSQWFPASFTDGYTNVALWGYAVADYSIEGQTFSKTMHDPCPPGYRTPFHFSWRYDSNYKYAEGDLGEAATTLTSAESGWDSNNRGIVTNKDYFEKMWFPFAGYRDPLTGRYVNVGSYGYMHTGMPMGQYNTRTFWYNQYRTAQEVDDGSAFGKMVRCMKE